MANDDGGVLWGVGRAHVVAAVAALLALGLGAFSTFGGSGASPGIVLLVVLLVALVSYALAWWRRLYVYLAPPAFLVAFIASIPAAFGSPAPANVAFALLAATGLVASIVGNSGQSSLWTYIARRLTLLVPVL